MKLIITKPFDWDGKHYAVGAEITDSKLIKSIRAKGPANHFVVVSTK